MAAVLLANAPYSLKERYGKLAPVGSRLPNLGLLMVGAVLQGSGHRVRIIDAPAEGYGYEKTISEIKKFHPDMVGLTAVTPSVGRAARLAAMIKDVYPALPIFIGGPHVTAVPEKTLKDYPALDCAVLGEGEETVIELVRSLTAGESLLQVPGIALRDHGEIKFAPPRDPVDDLDALPFPAWGLLEGFPSRYRPALFKYKRLPSMHLVSARGCPDRCIFCDNSVFGHRVRFHSAEYVLEMIRLLIRKHHIKEIIFEDDQFLMKPERVAEICEGVLRAGWNIAWSCSGRVNSVKDLHLLKLMKHAGCWQINYGIESASRAILEFAKKSIRIDQIEKAVGLTREAGILCKGYFIFGLPHETEKTMEKTIRFAMKIPLNDISVFMLTPFPGSRIYDVAEQYGSLDRDLEKWNLLDAVFIPTGLDRERLLFYQRRFMRKFYLRPQIVGSYFERLLANPRNFFNLLKAVPGFLRSVS